MTRARRRPRQSWTLVVVALVMLALAVAGVVGLVSAQAPTVPRADDVAVYSPPLGGRRPDVITGEIRREAGCTYLDADDDRRWVVLFPDLGTRWDRESLWVQQNRYWLGQTIHLRGDIVKLPVDGYDIDIPADCGETGYYFMVRI